MIVKLILQMPSDETLRGRRPCGCFKMALPDIVHWWRFTRLRMILRFLQGWQKYLQILWQSRSHQKVCKVVEGNILPILVGMGLMDPMEALEEVRDSEERSGMWAKWEKDQLFLGADSEHPDGIYAESGSDLANMTNEEWRHWYGGCSHSGGNEAWE